MEHKSSVESGAESAGVRLRRMFANTSIYAAGEVGLQLLTAIFTPLLTYYLAPSELGLWSLALMILTGLSTLYGLALHGAVTRFFYDHEHDEAARRRFQGTLLVFLLVWSLTLSVTLTVVGPWMFERLVPGLDFWPYGMFVVWMAFLAVASVVPKAAWAAAEQSKAFVSVSVLGSASYLLGALGLVMFTDLGVLGLFWGKTLSLVVLAVPFLLWCRRKVGLRWHGPDLKAALVFSLPLVPHLLAHWVLGMSDRLIIDHHYGRLAEAGEGTLEMGLAAVGIYSAGYVFIDAVNMVASSMNRAWVPQFNRAYGDPAERPFVARSITYFFLVIGSISAALFLLAPSLVRLLFEERYVAAADIASILALGGLFQGTYYIYVSGLFFHKKNGVVPLITLFSGGLNVALNLLWLPEHGLVGAAWATVVGYAALAVGARWGCRRITRLPFERKRIAKLFIVLAALCAGGVALTGLMDGWMDLLARLAMLPLGALALLATGFLTAEERVWVRARLPGGER